jgi:CubicO group peptidase (beta-lactamase class C family)
MFKKFLSVTALVATGYLSVSAQVTPLEKSTHEVALVAVDLLNKKMADSLYSMAGESLRKKLSATVWRTSFKNVVYPLLPLRGLAFQRSKDSLSQYRIKGTVPLMMYFSIDRAGKINNMSFQIVEEETGSPEMSAETKRTDSVARRMIRLVNEKKADSTYLLASERSRKGMTPNAWKKIMENSIYPLTPFADFVFIGTEGRLNKYRSGKFQFLVSIDQNDRIEMFNLQPYTEDVSVKKFNSDNALKTRLDSAVNRPLSTYMRTKGNVGLSAGIFYGGKDYYFNYGETRLENSLLPTNHTLYDIGSITKTFTSTLLALAVNEGKVKLSSPITEFLPDSVASNPALKGITLVQLANHTSGLPRMVTNWERTVTHIGQPYSNYDTKHLFSYLKSVKGIRPPGMKYEYSNSAVGLLGVILEKIYETPYPELVTKYILIPAKLNQTKFAIKGSDTALLAQGYTEILIPAAPWEFKAMQAIGVLKSSAMDLLLYGKLQLSDAPTPLSKAIKLTHVLTYKEDQASIGLGWHFLGGNPKIVWHNGATGGYRSLVCVDRERNIVVVVLTNNASNGDTVGFEVMRALSALK